MKLDWKASDAGENVLVEFSVTFKRTMAMRVNKTVLRGLGPIPEPSVLQLLSMEVQSQVVSPVMENLVEAVPDIAESINALVFLKAMIVDSNGRDLA